MPRTRYRIHEENYAYFFTSTIVAWLPLFSQPWTVEIIYNSWRFLQAQRSIIIFGYVIMENHLHWIAAGPELGKQVGLFKSFVARQIIDGLEKRQQTTLLQELQYFKLHHKIDSDHQVWQEGSHPKQIQGDEMMLQKLEYMHHNPLRRGYVEEATHWRYSSARNYAGMKGLLEVVTDWR